MQSEEKTLVNVSINNDEELIFRLDIPAILDINDLNAIYAIKARLDSFNYKLNQIIDDIIVSNDLPDCENCDELDTCEDYENCKNKNIEDDINDLLT